MWTDVNNWGNHAIMFGLLTPHFQQTYLRFAIKKKQRSNHFKYLNGSKTEQSWFTSATARYIAERTLYTSVSPINPYLPPSTNSNAQIIINECVYRFHLSKLKLCDILGTLHVKFNIQLSWQLHTLFRLSHKFPFSLQNFCRQQRIWP